MVRIPTILVGYLDVLFTSPSGERSAACRVRGLKSVTV